MIYRIAGSIDFVGASRSVLIAGNDPDNPDLRAICHSKSNVGPIGPAIGYEIHNGVFSWSGATQLDVDRMFEARQSSENRSKTADCIEWLRSLLTERSYTSGEIDKMAADNGFTYKMIRTAREMLKVRTSRIGFGKGATFVYELPEAQTSVDDIDMAGYNPWLDN